jgi:hypothetical protein
MKTIEEGMMKLLSFPDVEVSKMVFFPNKKSLQILVDGAFLEGGQKLEKGILYFDDWKSIEINRFDTQSEEWLPVEQSIVEPLRDLCEVNFSEEVTSMAGFGKETGQWVEWKISHPKMHAEFE